MVYNKEPYGIILVRLLYYSQTGPEPSLRTEHCMNFLQMSRVSGLSVALNIMTSHS